MLDLEAIRQRLDGDWPPLQAVGPYAQMKTFAAHMQQLIGDGKALIAELESARAMFGHAHREVVRLREAVKPFAEAIPETASLYQADHAEVDLILGGLVPSTCGRLTVTVGDFRRARAAVDGERG